MVEILQTDMPFDPFAAPPLPGIRPASMDSWLHMDEAFAEQMARRDELLERRRENVVALDPQARAAAEELLDLVLSQIHPGAGQSVTRADGRTIRIDRARPMDTLGRLVQEDLCILQKRGDEHVLTGAVLCFPASWSLSEKILRPLIAIHDPIDSYDPNIARRVQRLFDGIQAGRPLWRSNALWYQDPELFQPRSIHDRRERTDPDAAPYLRSERQFLLRLPETRAVVFSIHTYVLARPDAEALKRKTALP